MAITTYNSDSYDVLDLPDGYRGIKNDYLQKFLTFHGIPILAPSIVDNFAIQEARWTLTKIFQNAEHRIADMRARNLIIAIAPEIQDGLFDFGLENTRIILVGENNLINRDANTSILIHEVGHAIHNSLCQYEKNHIKTLYENRPFWGRDDAYALQNEYEYFAEGVGAYFNAGMPGEPIHTRAVLQGFDPPLYHTIDGILEQNTWLWQPINQRTILSEHTLAAEMRKPRQTIKEYHERR